MAGKFYPIKTIIDDKKYIVSLIGSMTACASIITGICSFLLAQQVKFDEIARVHLQDREEQPSVDLAKSISEIGKKDAKDDTTFYGYLSNVQSICNNPKTAARQQTIVVRQPNGATIMGKVLLDQQACEIIRKMVDDNYRFDAISSAKTGDQLPSYVFIQKNS